MRSSRQKRRVAFVHVENFRPDSDLVQRPHAADAEDDFLAHPHFEIAAVKLGGDQPIFRVVLRDVGIEQVKADAADLELPDFRENLSPKEADGDQQRLRVFPHLLDRQMMEILVEADGVLDAFLIDLLFEIAVPVEQPDGDKFEVEIAGGFAVIARRRMPRPPE